MTCRAFEHVGDSLDAAMWMIGKAADGTFEGIVEGEMVEEQEGVEFVADARRNGATQLDPCAFDGDLRFDHFFDSSKVVHAYIDVVMPTDITCLSGSFRMAECE